MRQSGVRKRRVCRAEKRWGLRRSERSARPDQECARLWRGGRRGPTARAGPACGDAPLPAKRCRAHRREGGGERSSHPCAGAGSRGQRGAYFPVFCVGYGRPGLASRRWSPVGPDPRNAGMGATNRLPRWAGGGAWARAFPPLRHRSRCPCGRLLQRKGRPGRGAPDRVRPAIARPWRVKTVFGSGANAAFGAVQRHDYPPHRQRIICDLASIFRALLPLAAGAEGRQGRIRCVDSGGAVRAVLRRHGCRRPPAYRPDGPS